MNKTNIDQTIKEFLNGLIEAYIDYDGVDGLLEEIEEQVGIEPLLDYLIDKDYIVAPDLDTIITDYDLIDPDNPPAYP